MGITNDQFPFIFLMVLNDPKCKEKSRQDLLRLWLLRVACLDIIYCPPVPLSHLSTIMCWLAPTLPESCRAVRQGRIIRPEGGTEVELERGLTVSQWSPGNSVLWRDCSEGRKTFLTVSGSEWERRVLLKLWQISILPITNGS